MYFDCSCETSQFKCEEIKKGCSVDGCDRPVIARNFCGPHYRRHLKYGDPLGGLTFHGEPLKFFQDVVLTCTNTDPNACLRWPFGFRGPYPQLKYEGKDHSVHRLVCIIKHGPPPFREAEACHNCGNAWCVNPHHLRWDDSFGNAHDKEKHDTVCYGERNGRTKLSDDLVREIWADEGKTYREIALRHGISETQAYNIKLGNTRKHLGLSPQKKIPHLIKI